MKRSKGLKRAHTDNSQFGIGDFYGTAIKQKLGRMRDSYVAGIVPATPKQLKTPPKSLA